MSVPSIVKVFRVESDDKLFTNTVKVYDSVAPEGAVIVTVTVFDPGSSSVLPETSTPAPASAAVATTETLVVPGATSTLPSTATRLPLTVIVPMSVLVDSGVR